MALVPEFNKKVLKRSQWNIHVYTNQRYKYTIKHLRIFSLVFRYPFSFTLTLVGKSVTVVRRKRTGYVKH